MVSPTTEPTSQPTGLWAVLTRPTVATIAPLIVGAVASLFAFQGARYAENGRVRAEFAQEVEHNMGSVRLRLNENLDSLRSLRNLFLLAESVHPVDFNRVAEELIRTKSALDSVAWVPRVPAAERASHLKWAKGNVAEEFDFVERAGDSGFGELAERSEYHPVYFQTPVGNAALRLGEDLGAVPDWLEKLKFARETGRVVMTGQMSRIADSPGSRCVLAITPVYRHQPLPATLLDRMELSTGFIVAVLDVGALIDDAVYGSRRYNVNVEANDLSGGRRRLLHFASAVPGGGREDLGVVEDTLRHNGQTEALTVGTRAWGLKFTPGQAWLDGAVSKTPRLVLLGGFALSLLLSRFTRTLARRNEKVEQLVAVRTKDLVRANERLRGEVKSRQKSEAELVDSEQRFRITFEEAPAGIGHASLVGKYLSVNDRLCEMTGYSREELLAGHWQDITHPDDVGSDEKQVKELLANQRATYSMDKRYLRKDGECVWVNLTVALVRDENQEPAYFISIVTDQTEYRRAQEQLESERNVLRTLIDGIPDSIYLKDREGRYFAQNRADRELLGLKDSESAVGKTVHDFESLRQHADLYYKDDMRVLQTGMPVLNREEPFVRPDGTEGWLLTTKLPLKSPGGEITGLIGITRDISNRKTDEREKIDMLKKLQTTQKLESMGLLAGGIAHDFNNLLTGIHGHAGLLRLSSDSYPELLPHIGEIEQAAQRASELCQQMLDYSGHNRHEDQRLDLNATIKQTLPLLRHSMDKKAELNFDPEETLPAFMGDPTQVRQILMNLVINASDAFRGSHGIIKVHTGVMRASRKYLDETVYDDDLPEGDYVFVEVADNGEGMSEEVLAKIFDPFFTTKKEGRGLGLATTIGIVRSHGGAIKIHSQQHQGTIFRVLLPASDKPAEQFPEDEQTGWNWRGAGKVLVIDDEETVRTVSARILEALGFDPVLASDGKEGADLFHQGAADYRLVLTDYSMPVMDGVETYRQIKGMRHDVPIILMSGYWEEKATEEFGPDLAGFVKKPFAPEQLRDQIKAAIAKSNRIVSGN